MVTDAIDRQMIARSYRRQERITIITRISVYHGYVIGYRGKGVTVAATPHGDAYAAFTYGTIQYAGKATVPDSTYGVWARWSAQGKKAELLDLHVPGLARAGFYGKSHHLYEGEK